MTLGSEILFSPSSFYPAAQLKLRVRAPIPPVPSSVFFPSRGTIRTSELGESKGRKIPADPHFPPPP